MPNAKYLNQKVAAAAAHRASAKGHEDARGAFEVWASRLTREQLHGAFQVMVEELARRANLDPDKLRQLLLVVRTLLV